MDQSMLGHPFLLSHGMLVAGFPRVALGLGIALGHPSLCTVLGQPAPGPLSPTYQRDAAEFAAKTARAPA